jgi:photosystem II stability/assembly factor-like uncharacterized protein
MSVVAPPEPPPPDELEALIPEARARQRRRWLFLAAGVAIAAGVGLAIWAAIPGGHSIVIYDHGHVASTSGQIGRARYAHRGISDMGTSGGVTWASDGHHLWLTGNHGRTWRNVRLRPLGVGLHKGNPNPLTNIAEVQFVDKQRGWASSTDRAGIYRTTDGGRTWRVAIPPGCYRGCDGARIDFLDARHGYALVGVRAIGSNKLFRTDDGGRTWQFVSQPPVWGPITFVNDLVGFAGGPGQMIIGPYLGPPIVTLYRTTDGGRTWSKYDIAGSDSFAELPIGVFGGKVVLVQNAANRGDSLNLNPGTVWMSGDGGGHWSGRPVPFGPGGIPSSFSSVSPRVWAISSVEDLYLTADAGRHWRKVVVRGLPPRTPIEKIAFSSPRLGWAIVGRRLAGVVGASTLLLTTDGGRHWTPAGPHVPKRRRHR